MFVSRTAKIETAVCTVVGAAAFVGIFFLTIAGGSEYFKFVLAMVFFAMFLIGSYWWIVLVPGRRL
ncbi:MAG: hypothetical protein M3N18_03170 [Actinomycetota bacterium]|nr:hypothetical protein [Actinomycetota bacterium]